MKQIIINAVKLTDKRKQPVKGAIIFALQQVTRIFFSGSNHDAITVLVFRYFFTRLRLVRCTTVKLDTTPILAKRSRIMDRFSVVRVAFKTPFSILGICGSEVALMGKR